MQQTQNDEESKEPAEDRSKNLEDVKTVSFHENAGTITTDIAAATSSSAEKPPTVPQKMLGSATANLTATSPTSSAAMTGEETKGVPDSGNRPSVRTSVNGSALPTSGNATMQ